MPIYIYLPALIPSCYGRVSLSPLLDLWDTLKTAVRKINQLYTKPKKGTR